MTPGNPAGPIGTILRQRRKLKTAADRSALVDRKAKRGFGAMVREVIFCTGARVGDGSGPSIPNSPSHREAWKNFPATEREGTGSFPTALVHHEEPSGAK